MSREFTPKQIEKYKRQKYISALNKCTKNLYKLFRDSNISYNDFKAKFIKLKDEIDSYSEVRLNSEHSKLTKEYIYNLYDKTISDSSFDNNKFNEIREEELTNLNRLQKLKNRNRYKKNKYNNIDSELNL